MFDDYAPLWIFKKTLNANEAPQEAKIAENSLSLIEVYAALALTALNPDFASRLSHPK